MPTLTAWPHPAQLEMVAAQSIACPQTLVQSLTPLSPPSHARPLSVHLSPLAGTVTPRHTLNDEMRSLSVAPILPSGIDDRSRTNQEHWLAERHMEGLVRRTAMDGEVPGAGLPPSIRMSCAVLDRAKHDDPSERTAVNGMVNTVNTVSAVN